MLCVDLDPQGNLTMSQGIDPDKVEKSLYDVLVNDMPISEIISQARDRHRRRLDRPGRAEIAMSTKIGRERSLEKALKEVAGDYDFVCIDTPPSLGLLTINALTAANKVIVPVQCEYLSMRGLVQLQNTLKMIQENLNPDVKIEGILPTMLDTRTVHAKEAVEILEENFGDLVFKLPNPQGDQIRRGAGEGVQRAQVRFRQQRRELLPGAGEGGSGEWLGVTSGRACGRAPLGPLPLDHRRRPADPTEGGADAGARTAGEDRSAGPRRDGREARAEAKAVLEEPRAVPRRRHAERRAGAEPPERARALYDQEVDGRSAANA